MLRTIDEAPCELACAIREFWEQEEWDNAASIAYEESGWDAFAIADTRDPQHPCGAVIRHDGGVAVTSELSIGYFQINACNFPNWPTDRFYNARHNAGTAHLLWEQVGGRWSGPWYFSAKKLGLS